MKKKAFLLACILSITRLFAQDTVDFSIDGIKYTGDRTTMTATVTGTEDEFDKTDVMIHEKVKEYAVTSIGDLAFRKNTTITSIVLPNSLKAIGFRSFMYCENLESVAFPENLEIIDAHAFAHCKKLGEINLPNTVTSIGFHAFANTGISSFTFPEKITEIAGALFSECENLEYIDIPSRITKIGSNAFELSGLKSVVIPDGITTIEMLTFNNCNNLESVTIPNSVKRIEESAFSGCKSLKTIELPAGLLSLEMDAVSSTGLTSFTLPKNCKLGDEGLSSPFTFCEDLESINVEEGNPYYDSRNGCNAIIITASNTLMGGCKRTKIPEDITKIDRYSFYHCGIKSVSIPEGVVAIEEHAFARDSLTEIVIPNSVTTIGEQAFYRCDKLTKLTIGASVETIAKLAFGRTALRQITSKTENPKPIDERAFDASAENYDIYASATLIVPKGTKDKYKATAGWKKFNTILEEGEEPVFVGDINNDGKVDVSDYIGIANRILGQTPVGFNEQAADVNGDGVIDVSDYIGVANIILTGNIHGK
jgi:hypothetical protein